MTKYAECEKWVLKDLTNLDRIIPVCRDKSACVQAGGNIGLFPERLRSYFKAVHTFEPQDDMFRAMEERMTQLRTSNVIMHKGALGEKEGRIQAELKMKPDKHEGTYHIEPAVGNWITVVSVDSLELKSCGLIYLDIEGYEPLALKGAEKTIKRCRPVIACEVNGNCHRLLGVSNNAIREQIMSYGYRRVGRRRSDDLFTPEEWGTITVEGFT